jgi:hypothetical protein
MMTDAAHRHTCTSCGHRWSCAEAKPLARCEVAKAARVNGEGPYCQLCLWLGMARRAATLRRLGGVAASLADMQRQVRAIVAK